VILEGAEVEHSIVLAGATIRHVGRRLEGSLIGRDVRIRHDFALPRGLRLTVGDRAEISVA
jgi:glucose-1-phosphate thymidylyltransferase